MDIDRILDNVYISNWNSSNNVPELHKLGIKYVITLETRPKPHDVLYQYQRYGIKDWYIHIADSPTSDIRPYLDTSFDIIQHCIRNKIGILIHCWAGVSRSASIILYYLVKSMVIHENIRYVKDLYNAVERAMKYFRSIRRQVDPNYGFLNQIIEKLATEYRMT